MKNTPNLQRIILIDDDILLKTVYKKIINSLKFKGEVFDFNNGFQAINHIQKEMEFNTDFKLTPTLIILDLEMPVLNGLGFLKGLGNFNPRLISQYKIIVSSNTINISDINLALNFETVEEYIPKPLTIDIFRILIVDKKN
ncbi:response regulator [Lunatibacter salilacus]|uniref:response regulator n=1 Tax=Lunatibacter salilacus TaxID=2483804 RepID=UPI00131DCCD7|nr:response regulator [Lunatibacter salilacus]